MAQEVLSKLESSGSIAMPRDMEPFRDVLGSDFHPGWKISLIGDSGGRQPTFINRLAYLDTLLVRALLQPERSMLQGEHGTLAEAGEHIDLALTQAELIHEHVVCMINWHAVDQLLALNYGDDMRGRVWIEAAPIIDKKLAFLREIYKLALTNPTGFLEQTGIIDWNALQEATGVPILEEEEEVEVDGTGDDIENSDATTNLVIRSMDAPDANDPMAASIRKIYRALSLAN
jgi:hypothetical protein